MDQLLLMGVDNKYFFFVHHTLNYLTANEKGIVTPIFLFMEIFRPQQTYSKFLREIYQVCDEHSQSRYVYTKTYSFIAIILIIKQKIELDMLSSQKDIELIKMKEANKIGQYRTQIDELLSCQICYCKATESTMCPHCSKIYCQNCISKSLKLKSECPHCRIQIKGNLTNCSRFINELSQIVDVLIDRQQQNQICPQHGINLNYYCQDCNKPACCQCKMFGQHQHHKFINIDIVYRQKYDQIREMLSQLKIKIIDKQAQLTNISNQLENIKINTLAQIAEIEEFTQKYKNKMTKQLKSRTNQQLQASILEIQQIQTLKKEIIIKFEDAKRRHNFQRDDMLVNKIQDILLRNREEKNKVTAMEEAIPLFQKFSFEIHNYSICKNQKKPFYSQQWTYEGSQWRSTLYLSGNTYEGKYLSIFLELLSSPDKGNLYNYCIQIVNVKDQKANLKREHHSKFQMRQSWGFSKFIPIEQLEKGFVDKASDSIQFNIYIKLPHYYDIYERRKILISMLNNEIEEQNEAIKVLEDQIAKKSKSSIQID